MIQTGRGGSRRLYGLFVQARKEEETAAPTMNGDHSSQRPASAASRMHDRSKGDQGGGIRQSNTTRLPNPKPGSPLKFGRGKRLGHTTSRNFPCSTALLLVLCLVVVLITIYSSEVISSAFRGQLIHLAIRLLWLSNFVSFQDKCLEQGLEEWGAYGLKELSMEGIFVRLVDC